jgi:hypothetical protein
LTLPFEDLFNFVTKRSSNMPAIRHAAKALLFILLAIFMALLSQDLSILTVA